MLKEVGEDLEKIVLSHEGESSPRKGHSRKILSSKEHQTQFNKFLQI